MLHAFPPWADTAFRIGLIGIALAIPGVFVVPILYSRTPYNLNRHNPIVQPVQFDHRHHAQDDGIACLYCHDGAERSPYAGVPATEVCMGCHSQIWNTSAMLEPVDGATFRVNLSAGIASTWFRTSSFSIMPFTCAELASPAWNATVT